MSSTAAIEVVIVDDAFDAPELAKIGAKIVVKMPPNASLKTMVEKIMDRYPVLRASLINLYFFDENGKFQKLSATITTFNLNIFLRPIFNFLNISFLFARRS